MGGGEAAVAAGAEPAFESTSTWGDPSDHKRVVGHLAIGYLGVMGIPIHGGLPVGSGAAADPTTGGTASGSGARALLYAPTLGIRYWISESLGLDAGLGLGLAVTGGSTIEDSAEADAPGATLFGMGFHVGLPISVWHTAHYNGLLVPEVNFAFATGDDEAGTPETDDDESLSGLLFQVGIRAGAEFHLEFLEIPQASLQLTVGLGFVLETRNAEDAFGSTGDGKSELSLRTNLMSIGDAVASGVQAFFYF